METTLPVRMLARAESLVNGLTAWSHDHPHAARTPIDRLVKMADVAHATDFLLDNTGTNGHELVIDGGMMASWRPTGCSEERVWLLVPPARCVWQASRLSMGKQRRLG